MIDLHPLLLEKLGGGQGQLRRARVDQLESMFAQLASWAPEVSILARTAAGAAGIALQPGQVLGRGAAGSLQGLGAAELDALLGFSTGLAGRAPLAHNHTFVAGIRDINWGTLAENTILARQGGEFRWIGIPNGGGGNVNNPLTSALNIAGFPIVSGDPPNPKEVLRVEDGVLYICGVPYVPLPEGDPQPGHIWLRDPGGWIHRKPDAKDIDVEPERFGGNVETAILLLESGLQQAARIGHVHAASEIRGGTPGKFVRFDADGRLEEVDAPVGGGTGLTNPLNQDLDLGGFRVVTGTRKLIEIDDDDRLCLDGKPVWPTIITDPVAGQVGVYDEGAEAFVNRKLSADCITIASGAVPGGDVEAALGSLTTAVNGKAAISHQHPLGQVFGTTPGKYLRVGPAPLRQLEEVDIPLIPEVTEFPDEPADGFKLLHLGRREFFVFRAGIGAGGEGAWMAFSECAIAERARLVDGAGDYFVGDGQAAGHYFGRDAVLTGLDVSLGADLSGDIVLELFDGTTAEPLHTLSVNAAANATESQLELLVPSGSTLSVRLDAFPGQIPELGLRIHYRTAEIVR